MRVWGIEKESFTLEIAKTDAAGQPATRAAQAFRTLSDESRSLDILHRYETRYDRQYARSYYLLRKARSPSVSSVSSAVKVPVPAHLNLPYEPSPNIEHLTLLHAPDTRGTMAPSKEQP
jgi:hypothetical protein